MRHRIHVERNRHIAQTVVYAPTDSYPIPAWGTGPIKAGASKIEKLKQFCLQNRVYPRSPALAKSCQPKTRTPIQLIVFLGLGISLYLSANAFRTKLGLSNVLSLATLDRSLLYAEAAQDMRDLFWLDLWETFEKFTVEDGAPANFQGEPKSIDLNRSTNKFIFPAEGFAVTSYFGNRVHPLFGNKGFHRGIDIGTPSGTPIKASRAGYVKFSGWDRGYGKTIIIHHEEGYETLYAHLDKLLVKVGDQVTQENVIGLSGSTGYVTGPHLHFELRLNRVARNPLDYL